MKFNPDKHHRRSIRLKGYDYAGPGAYFITIVAQDRACLFGEVVDCKMLLNDAGRMVHREWSTLPARFTPIRLDAFVIMPNHCHGIIMIEPPVGATLVVAPVAPVNRAGASPAPTVTPNAVAPGVDRRWTLGDIVGAFKSITTHAYIQGIKQFGWSPFSGRLWQHNYFEHTIRNEASLGRIREYIVNNPLQWELDREHPSGSGTRRIVSKVSEVWEV